jgi:hypothetical protein
MYLKHEFGYDTISKIRQNIYFADSKVVMYCVQELRFYMSAYKNVVNDKNEVVND